MKFFIRLIAPCMFLALAFSGCQDRQQPFEAGPEGPSLAGAGVGLARAMAVQNQHTPRLLAMPDVVGTATGLGPAGTPAVLVLTKVPGVAGIPRNLDGVPVVVKVTGEIVALVKPDKPDNPNKPDKPGKPGNGDKIDPKDRFERPVPIGVSTGNEGECSSGTVGCRVKNGKKVYALSNNHVYALENNALIGSKVLQPGRFDTDCVYDEGNVIGTLSAFVPIVFTEDANNMVDAAIALSSTANLGNATPSDGYGTPKSTTVTAALNQKVQKYGRTTGLTKGVVTGINLTAYVTYSSGTARFINQIIVESRRPFIKAGDSGSLLVTDPGCKPVGLLFAGNGRGRLAVANPIDAVLGSFSVTIDGE